jgi:hypothetical protein
MSGRTVSRWTRVWLDGYNVSGNARSLGPLGIVYDEADLTALSDPVKGYLPNHYQVNVDVLNGLMDNADPAGLHTIAAEGARRTFLAAFGQLAEPQAGDVCFGGQFQQGAGQAVDDGGGIAFTVPFMGWAADAEFPNHYRAFGCLLHAEGAEDAANDQIGIDDNGGPSAHGGYMLYHVLAGDGDAELLVEDAETNLDASFAPLTGCATGNITMAAGVHGIVRATTDTVRRYLRWQLTLDDATEVAFVMAFFRG